MQPRLSAVGYEEVFGKRCRPCDIGKSSAFAKLRLLSIDSTPAVFLENDGKRIVVKTPPDLGTKPYGFSLNMQERKF